MVILILSGYFSEKVPIHATDDYNNTALHLAALSGHSATVELLLENGALIQAINKDSDIPMDLAGKNEHTDTVLILANKMAKGAECVIYGTSTKYRYLVVWVCTIPEPRELCYVPIHP